MRRSNPFEKLIQRQRVVSNDGVIIRKGSKNYGISNLNGHQNDSSSESEEEDDIDALMGNGGASNQLWNLDFRKGNGYGKNGSCCVNNNGKKCYSVMNFKREIDLSLIKKYQVVVFVREFCMCDIAQTLNLKRYVSWVSPGG